MYDAIVAGTTGTAGGAGASHLQPPAHPAWLRLAREPLRSAERAVLAARRGAVGGADAVAELLRERALAEEVECFYVLVLDAKLHLIALEEVARGSVAAISVRASEVLRLAVVFGAFAIILAHNHPSGDPLPSKQDIEFTRRVVSAGEVVGIQVLDHVILAGGPAVRRDWSFSFRDHGLVIGP